MIRIYVDYPEGAATFTVDAVPRVGETVYIKDRPFTVQEVKHRLQDRYTEYGIAVVLEEYHAIGRK